MMKIHAIAGMPRSGSTLLCNILNSRPGTTATPTSALPGFIRALGGVASSRIEVKQLLNLDLEGTQARFAGAVRAFCETWHSGSDVVFDKSRGWNFNAMAFRDISPDGRILLCVRDLRDIFASVERQESKNGLITAASPSVAQRYREAFDATGVIGSPYAGVCDLIDTNPDNILVVHYESLVADPDAMMRIIEAECGLDHFEYDFDNVPDTMSEVEPDGFWLGKFPHKACGKVENRCPHWSENVPISIAQDIMQKAPKYNRVFGYTQAAPDTQSAVAPVAPCIDCTDSELEAADYV
jgi:sulfotransferase